MTNKTWQVALTLLSLLATVGAPNAAPVSLDPAHPISVYDTGGQLNLDNNGGFFLGGLEADPAGGAVYVVSEGGAAAPALRLIRSNGLGTAVFDGSGPQPWVYESRGNDLTYLSGNYYVAACVFIPGKGKGCQGTPGVYGFVPGVGATTFASGGTIPGWATSGLTFNESGTAALVSSDVGIGMWTVTPPSSGVEFVNDDSVPTGYGAGVDDHVVMLDGRIITIGDSSRLLHDVTGGPGAVFEFFDLADIPGSDCGIPKSADQYAGNTGNKGMNCEGVGSRGAVDPVSGDIFVAMGSGGTTIFRIAADGSSGSIFATGFAFVRDLDFGPSSASGGNLSLYVTEVTGIGGGGKGPIQSVGTIYEIDGFFLGHPTIPTLNIWGLAALVLVLIAGGFVFVRRRRLV